MTSPIKPVHITSSIHNTELSIPLLLASRATQTSKATCNTNKAMLTKRKAPPQAAHPAAALASSPCMACAKRLPVHAMNGIPRINSLLSRFIWVKNVLSHGCVNMNFDRKKTARCLINKDTVGRIRKSANDAHCLINQDTVAHGQNHESINPRRIPRKDA